MSSACSLHTKASLSNAYNQLYDPLETCVAWSVPSGGVVAPTFVQSRGSSAVPTSAWYYSSSDGAGKIARVSGLAPQSLPVSKVAVSSNQTCFERRSLSVSLILGLLCASGVMFLWAGGVLGCSSPAMASRRPSYR